MTATPAKDERTARLIEKIEDAGEASLKVVRKFLDSLDAVFPDLDDAGRRRKIIDSAFAMTEHLVGTASRLAQDVLEETQKTMSDSVQKPAKKAVPPAKAAKAGKSAKKSAR